MTFSKTKTTTDYNKPKRVKNVYGIQNKPSKLKTKTKSEKRIMKLIRELFKLKKLNKAIKDRIIGRYG